MKYRSFKLLKHGMKVIEKIFEKQLRNILNLDKLHNAHGFEPLEGTVDAIFISRQMFVGW